MKTMFYFVTLFLVCLTLCLKENQNENDEDEFLEEMLEREKRDAMPRARGKHLIFQFLIMLGLERTKNTLNETLHKLWHGTSNQTHSDVHRCPPVVYDFGILNHFRPKNHTRKVYKIHKDFCIIPNLQI